MVTFSTGFPSRAVEIDFSIGAGIEEKSLIAVVRSINGRQVGRLDLGEGWTYSNLTAGMYAYCSSLQAGNNWALPSVTSSDASIWEIAIEVAPWGARRGDPVATIQGARARLAGMEGAIGVKNASAIGLIARKGRSQ